jgi:hypothetical protein
MDILFYLMNSLKLLAQKECQHFEEQAHISYEATTAKDPLVAIGIVGTFVAIGIFVAIGTLLPLEHCCHWNFVVIGTLLPLELLLP